ncbi:hypothetical protein [Actinoplanes palleronii]|uniref:Uncharacterized protein n=1 Tax=Actinoplanes palleronii TaxID=113570 RepID=A0ABQ4BRX1_9ACTN|nr:hypothetical protein Apa02nite_095240 [Actinoplanes palleronii]
MDTIEAHFTRPEPRRRFRYFDAGLLAPLPVKNYWTIAEHAGDDGPGAVTRSNGRTDHGAIPVRCICPAPAGCAPRPFEDRFHTL